jgi:class 3 adenylate cyclase/tetratricopeptide (TPR) repeat protein
VDIAAWLRELGLERYESVFRDNEIDAQILPKLTADDLRDIGVTAVGHRRKLVEAIAALTAADETAPRRREAARTRAERRQLTVLFCDLVGSTELSARLDPEDMSEIIRTYQDACAEVIGRWDGHVARYLGDGVLAYFGYPSAREDDAERAVRAGLDLVAAVGRLKTGDGQLLAARVGIATGKVVVGDLIGKGAAQEEAVVGETPNLAARLQALAEPGSVAIAAITRSLLGGLFELTDLGPVGLKGFAEPQPVWRVVGEGRAEGRFEALRGGHLTPLVGREHELGLVLERWALAKEAQGQVIMISGEAGIGKSRIVRAFREQLASESHVALSHFCSRYHTNTALHPIMIQLERAAGFAPDDEPETKLVKLQRLLAQATNQLDEAVPLIAALLDIPSGEDYPALNLSPQRQKQRTLEVLVEQLVGLARHQPVLVVFEDTHWADASTLELLDLLVERVRRLRVLVVVTFRPEFAPRWTGQAHVTSLPLNRLDHRQAAAMVARLTVGKTLQAEVIDQILTRTEGMPLFIEELTKTVVEAALRRDAGDPPNLAGAMTPIAIPSSLHDSLMARLDRLGSAKTVAQIAAVLGHSFDTTTMRLLWDGSDESLAQGLDRLVDESLIIRWGIGPHAHFMFKHALIEEIAYESLLQQDRRKFHLRAAEILCAHAGDLVRVRPELVARHYSVGGLTLPAFDAWLKAGRAAIRRSANAEALGHLRNAEAELLKLEKVEAERLDDRRMALHMARAPALIALSGWAAPEVEQAYRSALMASERAGARGQDLFDVWRGLYNVYLLRGDLRSARGVAAHLEEIATESSDRGLFLGSHRAVGLCDFLAGEFHEASKHLEEAISLYDPAQHRHHAFAQGTDPAVIAHSINGWTLWFLGHFDGAVQNSADAIEAARRAEHPFSMAYALCLTSSLAQCRGQAAEAASCCDAALKLSMEHAFPYWHAWASIVKGWALVELGDRDAGFPILKDGLERYAAVGAAQMRSYGLCLLAEAHQRAGLWAESAEAATAAIAEAERTGITFYLAEAYRLSGKALCDLRPTQTAGLRMLVKAVRVAERQRSDPLLLRAYLSILALSRRKRLRAVRFARAMTTLRRMQSRCGSYELDMVEKKLIAAAAEAPRADSPQLPDHAAAGTPASNV